MFNDESSCCSEVVECKALYVDKRHLERLLQWTGPAFRLAQEVQKGARALLCNLHFDFSMTLKFV